MNFKFPVFKLRLVLLGIALGFLARFIPGGLEKRIENERRFHGPIDATLMEKVYDAPDFPLEPVLRQPPSAE